MNRTRDKNLLKDSSNEAGYLNLVKAIEHELSLDQSSIQALVDSDECSIIQLKDFWLVKRPSELSANTDFEKHKDNEQKPTTPRVNFHGTGWVGH